MATRKTGGAAEAKTEAKTGKSAKTPAPGTGARRVNAAGKQAPEAAASAAVTGRWGGGGRTPKAG